MAKTRSNENPIQVPWEKKRRKFRWPFRTSPGIIVLSVLGLVAIITLWSVESTRRAEYSTRVAIANVLRAVEAFRADHDGRCPNGFSELLSPGPGQEPYLTRAPRDGWGHELRMLCPGRKNPTVADISSTGPSGNFTDREQIE